MMRSMRWALLLLVTQVGFALADDAIPRPKRDFVTITVFWGGAALVMFLVARIVFREHINERRTIQRLVKEIGPFFSEFDTDAINHWIKLCAPHVFAGWRNGDMSGLVAFASPTFIEGWAETFAEGKRQGFRRKAQLEEVLKVHPLGLEMVGDGPAPTDVALTLRLEMSAIDCTIDADDKVVRGSAKLKQIQQFWTLRNDGHQWRLHRVEPAKRDRVDLAKKVQPPPLFEWRRPQDQSPQGTEI